MLLGSLGVNATQCAVATRFLFDVEPDDQSFCCCPRCMAARCARPISPLTAGVERLYEGWGRKATPLSVAPSAVIYGHLADGPVLVAYQDATTSGQPGDEPRAHLVVAVGHDGHMVTVLDPGGETYRLHQRVRSVKHQNPDEVWEYRRADRRYAWRVT